MEVNYLTKLKRVNGNLFLNCMTNSKGLYNLEYVGKTAYFNNMIDTSGLISLKSVESIKCKKYKYIDNRFITK